MKSLKFTLTGNSPLLMHKYIGNGHNPDKDATPEVLAAVHAYYGTHGNLVLPMTALHRAMIKASSKVKKGIGGIVSGTVSFNHDLDLGTKNYVVDSRSAVNKKTQGGSSRVMVHRPKLEEWKASGEIFYDETLLAADIVKKVLRQAGVLIGVGSYRPEHSGPFGRFEVEFESN